MQTFFEQQQSCQKCHSSLCCRTEKLAVFFTMSDFLVQYTRVFPVHENAVLLGGYFIFSCLNIVTYSNILSMLVLKLIFYFDHFIYFNDSFFFAVIIMVQTAASFIIVVCCPMFSFRIIKITYGI